MGKGKNKRGFTDFLKETQKNRLQEFDVDFNGKQFRISLVKPGYELVRQYSEFCASEDAKAHPEKTLDEFGKLVAAAFGGMEHDQALEVFFNSGGFDGPLVNPILQVCGLGGAKSKKEDPLG